MSPKAFSYVRFSMPSQAEGGSLARQTDLATAYCKRKGLALDNKLTMHDLGVSAFRGDNAKQGALAMFLEAVRVGRVPAGSTLIVESVDRISRQGIDEGYDLCKAILKSAVNIVTLQPEREYGPDAVKGLAKGALELQVILERAHEESAMKSHRRKHGWETARARARAGGGPMLKTCPAWLEVADGQFQVKEKAAAVVQRIYALARSGLGVYRITETLNKEKVSAIGNGKRWVKAYVYRVLTNPAAMGTYQPMRMKDGEDGNKVVPDGDPIAGYYPAVVSEKEWDDARAAINGRGNGRGAGRKGAEETNLFSGLLSCAVTGERMHIVNGFGRKPTKRSKAERKRYRYLVPSKEAGSAKGERIDYEIFERAILSKFKELKPSDIADDPGPRNQRQSEIARLSGRLLDLDNKLERTRERARAANGDFDAFLDLIADLQRERKEVSERLAELEHEQDGRTAADLGETHSLIALLDAARPEQRGELRRRLKARIRQLVAWARMLIVRRGRTCLCAVQLWFRGDTGHRIFLIVHRPGNRYTGGKWYVRSVADDPAEPLDFDFRKPHDVGKLARMLESIDLED